MGRGRAGVPEVRGRKARSCLRRHSGGWPLTFQSHTLTQGGCPTCCEHMDHRTLKETSGPLTQTLSLGFWGPVSKPHSDRQGQSSACKMGNDSCASKEGGGSGSPGRDVLPPKPLQPQAHRGGVTQRSGGPWPCPPRWESDPTGPNSQARTWLCFPGGSVRLAAGGCSGSQGS